MKSYFALPLLALAATAHAHEPIEWQGSEVQVILEKDDSNGEMGMFTVSFSGPGGPPRHVHADAGEALLVLEGEAEFLNDGDRIIVKEGEAAYVPKGAEHTFRVLGESGGKLLVVVAPGGFEGFFDASKHVKMPEGMDEMKKISESFGIGNIRR